MKIRNKIITVIYIMFLMILGVQSISAQTSEGILEISAISCSGTTAYNAPPSNLFDSSFSSAWNLNAGSTSGWVEAELDEEALVYGIELAGTISTSAALRVQFLQNEQWFTYTAGKIGPGSYGSTFFDLSFNRVITKKVRVVLEGSDASACEIKEITIKGKYRKDILSLAPVKQVKPSENSSFMYPPENLIDGSVFTEWKTATSYHGFKSDYSKKPDSIKDYFFRKGKESKCLPPYRSESSVVFELEKEVLLETILLYFSGETKGDIEIYAKDGKHWEFIEMIPEGVHEGWHRVSVNAKDIATDRVKIELKYSRGDFHEGLAEVEIWGYNGFKGDSYVSTTVFEPQNLSVPLNGTFFIEKEKDGSLEIAFNGVVSSEIIAGLNGRLLSNGRVKTINNHTIVSFPVKKGQLWEEDNYFKVYTIENTVVESVYFRMSENTREQIIVDDSLTDYVLFTEEVLPAEKIIEFGRNVLVQQVELYAWNPGYVKLSVWQNDDWQETGFSDQEPGALLYLMQVITNKIKLETSGNAPGELRILASPTKDCDPVVKILWPNPGDDIKTIHVNCYNIVGFVDNPDTTVTINGVQAEKNGQDFWIAMKDVGINEPGEYTITATAVDGTSRQGSDTVSFLYNFMVWFRLAGKDGFFYTSTDTVNISGYMLPHQYKITIDDVEADYKRSSFGRTIEVEEGFTLVPVKVYNKRSGKLLATVYAKVIRYSGDLKLVVDFPPENYVTTGCRIDVRGRVDGIGKIYVKVNNKHAQVNGKTFEAKKISLKEGINTITITAYDKTGRKTTKTITVLKDTKKPVIGNIQPAQDTLFTVRSVTVSGTVTDANTVWVYVNGTPAQTNNGTFSLMFDIRDGYHTLPIYTADGAGNQSEIYDLRIVVDTTAPQNLVVTADPSGWTSNTQPVISFSADDATTGIARYELWVDQGTPQTVTSPYTLPKQTDGEHAVFVKVYDNAGWTTTGSTKIFIDTVAPPVVPYFRTIAGKDNIALKWQKPAEDVMEYHIYRNTHEDEVYATLDGEALYYKDPGLEITDVYEYKIIALDRAGNASDSTDWELCIVGITQVQVESGKEILAEYENVILLSPADPFIVDDDITVEKILISEIESPEMEALSTWGNIVPLYNFSVVLKKDDKLYHQEHINFSKEMLCGITYDEEAIPEDFGEENLGVYYFDIEWGKWFKIGKCAVDKENNIIYFKTNHFSTFSVQPTLIEDLSPQELSDVGYSPLKSQSVHEGVTVSPQGGTAQVQMTEFVLIGKNGFDFILKRGYDSATARGDSVGINLNINIKLKFSELLESFDAIGQLVSVGQQMGSQFEQKLKSYFQNAGDYAYTMGTGWRLNLPYIRSMNSQVMVRTPSGSFHSMATMKKSEEMDIGIARELVMVNHENEDFILRVQQTRVDISVTGLVSEALRAGLTEDDDFNISNLKIPGWILFNAQMIMKDGTKYYFDSLGRTTKIEDPQGLNVINFKYNESSLTLDSITDSMGRVVRFKYDHSWFSPRITKMWIEGDDEDAYVEYTQEEGIIEFTPISTPLLVKARDIGGREWHYDYDFNFLFSGGGSVKINIISLIFSLIPATSLLADAFLPAPIELSGNAQAEFVFLLSEMWGPGIGYSVINTKKQPLFYGKAELTDYLLGIIPTAIQFSFQLINRMYANRVDLYDSYGGNLIKTTTYDYDIDYVGDGQFITKTTVEDDGRQRKVYSFDKTRKQRWRYITWSDWAVDNANSALFTESPWYYEYSPYNTRIETYDSTTNRYIETQSMDWYTKEMRLKSQRIQRSNTNYMQSEYVYDNWANPTYIKETMVSGGRSSKTETWMHYANTNSSLADLFRTWANPYGASFIADRLHNLLLAKAVKNIPSAESGLVDPIYLVSYNNYTTLGQLSESSQWTEADWAETAYTYNTAHGSIETVTNPNGHVTEMVYDYDFASHPGYYTVTSIQKDVADADGGVRNISSTQAFSFGRGNLLWDKNPEGYVSENQFDNLGRVIKITEPDDDAGEKTWNPRTETRPNAGNNPVTTIEYNDIDLWSRVTNANGAEIFYDYDNIGRLDRIEKENEGDTQYAVIEVENDAWNNITAITDPNGNTTNYDYDVTGRLVMITHPPYNGTAHTRTMSFNYESNTLTTTDENGNIKIEFFDVKNNLLKSTLYNISDGTETIESFVYYDSLGNTVAAIDPLGNKSINVYDARNLLERTILPEEEFFENGTAITVSPYIRYEYDPAGIKTKDIASTPDGEQVVVYESNGLGQVIKTRTTFSDSKEGKKETITEVFYDNLGNQIKVIDANNVALKYAGKQYYTNDIVYNAKNKPLVQAVSVLHDISGSVIDEGKKTTFAYDVLGNVESMTGPRGNSGSYSGDFILAYHYDDLNRLVKADLPAGTGEAEKRIVQFVYDKRGNALERIEPDNAKTVYTYTTRNKVETETISGDAADPTYTTTNIYDGLGNEKITRDNMNHEIKKTYDSLSRVVMVQYPEGNSEQIKYDKNSNVTATTDGEGRITTQEYNAFKKLTALVDAMGNRYEYFYNRLGNKTKEQDPNSNVFLYEYDELNRLLKETTSLGNEFTYRYDLVANIIESVDANGTIGVYEYTPEYLIDNILYTNGGSTHALSYSYDEAGDMMSARDGDVMKRYNSTGGTYTPDPYSRILNLTTEFDTRTTTVGYSYDIRDRITGVTYPNGNMVNYEYNSIGQLVNVPGYIEETPTYNDVGLITRLKAINDTETVYEYDNNLRLTNLSSADAAPEEIRSYAFTYDNANNIVRKNNSSYNYDRLNRLVYAEENGRFNVTDPTKEHVAGLAEKDFTGESALSFDLTETAAVKLDYNAGSVGIDLGGSYFVSRLEIHPQNSDNRIHAKHVDVFAATVNTEGQYTKVGIKTLVTRDDGVIEIRLDDAVQARYIKVHCYFDDRDVDNNPVDRATVENTALSLLTVHYMVDWRNESFQYDAIGNRMKQTVSLGSSAGVESLYTYYKNTEGGDSQRLESDGTYTYVYDNNGNLVQKTETATGNGWQYEFNLLNRLVGVSKIEDSTTTLVAHYLYDESGYRIKKESVEQGITYYTFSANGVVLLTEKEDNSTQYIYVFNRLFGKIETEEGVSKKYFYHTDHLGSTVAITNEAGEVVWKNEFTPFGEETGYEGSEEHEGKYTGKDFDEEIGLYYSNERWYDPELGRFISVDPIKDGVNWYVYCSNNPLIYIDPSGLDLWLASQSKTMFGGGHSLGAFGDEEIGYYVVETTSSTDAKSGDGGDWEKIQNTKDGTPVQIMGRGVDPPTKMKKVMDETSKIIGFQGLGMANGVLSGASITIRRFEEKQALLDYMLNIGNEEIHGDEAFDRQLEITTRSDQNKAMLEKLKTIASWAGNYGIEYNQCIHTVGDVFYANGEGGLELEQAWRPNQVFDETLQMLKNDEPNRILSIKDSNIPWQFVWEGYMDEMRYLKRKEQARMDHSNPFYLMLLGGFPTKESIENSFRKADQYIDARIKEVDDFEDTYYRPFR